jgi:hypothetical protein
MNELLLEEQQRGRVASWTVWKTVIRTRWKCNALRCSKKHNAGLDREDVLMIEGEHQKFRRMFPIGGPSSLVKAHSRGGRNFT